MNLDPAAESLTAFLGDLTEEMPPHDYSGFQLAKHKIWELDCNWKVYVDNYLEGYHIPIVHPGLFRELDYANYRTETKRMYSIQLAPTRKPERIRTANGDDRVSYFWIFPNLMLNVYPDNFSTNLIVPLGHGRTADDFRLVLQATPRRRRCRSTRPSSSATRSSSKTSTICEAVQRGLRSSTYDAGRFSPQRENGVHHFHRLYEEYLANLSS